MGKLSDLVNPDRYKSQARIHALSRSATVPAGSLPTYEPSTHPSNPNTDIEAGGLDPQHVRGPPSGPATKGGILGADLNVDPSLIDGVTDSHAGSEKTTLSDAHVTSAAASTDATSPPVKSEAPGSGDSALGTTEPVKPSIPQRMAAGSKRFVQHFKNAIFHSWINVLLIFVPLGIVVKAIGLNATVVFAINAIAIIPLAGLLSHATESVASRLGDTLGALLNVSFGNAVELIIFIIALVKNEIRIVQASLLGSILANLLLILGMAFLLGGLRFREQVYNSTVTQMSACLLSLSVTSLLLPTAFYASFNDTSRELADSAVLKVSRATSVILLIIYLLYLVFQLKSHAYMYESTPQAIIDEESHPGVLADIMNSSSSSDDSSSSDSSDSDGSIMTTGKRVRRMFKNRKRRKSSVSAGSTRSPSVIMSTSSPSINQPDNYWDHHHNSHSSTTRPRLGDIASGDEADEDGMASPRIRDFGSVSGPPEHSSKGIRKHRKKHSRHKHRKSRRDSTKDAADEPERSVQLTDGPSPAHRVEFSDDVQVAENQATVLPPSRRAFNMRQYRPALPKVLSNNVFVQPSPYVVQAARPALPLRSVSEATGLRRTNSLPDRLAKQQNTVTPNIANRTGPLPPYQHQRVPSSRPDNTDRVSIDSDDDGPPIMSRTAAVILLLCSTCLVAVCAEFMVDAIPEMIANSPSVSQAFIGLIILPIVGNAAEHVTAVTVATKNKMDLAIGVAVGSSIQIALFVTPIVVLLGWILHTDMSLYFNLFETVSLVATAFVINFLILDGRSNYLEGSLLIAVYVIIAVVAFFYPETAAQSEIGGGGEEAHMARRAAGEIVNMVGQALTK